VTIAFTNLLPFNFNFSFGKSQKSQGAKYWAVGGLTDLGDVMLSQKKACTREWQAHCHDEAGLLARSF
jgi:hypothetical protein